MAASPIPREGGRRGGEEDDDDEVDGDGEDEEDDGGGDGGSPAADAISAVGKQAAPGRRYAHAQISSSFFSAFLAGVEGAGRAVARGGGIGDGGRGRTAFFAVAMVRRVFFASIFRFSPFPSFLFFSRLVRGGGEFFCSSRTWF